MSPQRVHLSFLLLLASFASSEASSDLLLRKRHTPEDHHHTPERNHDTEIDTEMGYWNANVQFQSFTKIAKCFGDCDVSDQCQDGLVCYHREIGGNNSDIVPGCSNADNWHLDTTNSVCIAPEDMPREAHDRAAPIRRRRSLLSLCQGDCDRDSDCRGNLICLQRGVGDPVPGCANKYLGTRKDYCVPPSSRGNNGYNDNGMGLCAGDCDQDSDCAGDLICYQRDAYDPIPRGCMGRMSYSTDFCVKPNSNKYRDDNRQAVVPSKSSTTSSRSFRLKLYWEPGYDWQDQYYESKWCLTRDYNIGGTCWAGLRRERCSGDKVYVTKCSGSYKQLWNFEYVNSEESLIKIYDQDRCLQRSGIDIEVRQCNPNSQYQRFFALRGGLNEYRFELSQKTASRYCLNQDHHPKNAEYVQVFPCTWSRASAVSYWERY